MINKLKAVKNNKLYQKEKGVKFLLDNLNLIGKTPTPDESLDNIFRWIKASFNANKDGGSSAYYQFRNGWKGSYPETTGYLIPTMYEYSQHKHNDEWAKMAETAAEWLLSIQHPDGGWQGLQVDVKCEPRVFNSAMILDGLIVAYKFTGNEKYFESAKRGLDWIIGSMDSNGFFSENNVVKGGSFDTLVCACLLMVIQYLPEPEYEEYVAKVKKSLDAHLKFQTENAWFSNCNFQSNNTALLHHLGYTLDGLIISSEILKDETYYTAAKKTAAKLLSKFEVNLELPAYIKSDWTTFKDLGNRASLCLTGYSQIAIVFQKIYKRENDLRYLNAALKIIDIVGSIGNYKSRNNGINFGLAGSFPVNGNYQSYQIVNWAAKYHAESVLLAKEKCIPKNKSI